MPVTRANVDFAKRIFRDRLGNPYVYGGVFSPTNVRQGCDCSALVAHELNAVLYGSAMKWQRVDPATGGWITTESWRPIEVGQRGPFGTITAASAAAIPADAVVKIALHHGPGGGANSHMNCTVDGVLMESSGDHGVCTTGSGAIPLNSSYWNDWAYLPGPIGASAPSGGAVNADSELTKLFASRSPYRTDDKPFETLAGFVLNVDRMLHMQLVESAALRGERWAIDLVRKVADGRDDHAGSWLWYPDGQGKRQKDTWAAEHARAVLSQVDQR